MIYFLNNLFQIFLEKLIGEIKYLFYLFIYWAHRMLVPQPGIEPAPPAV